MSDMTRSEVIDVIESIMRKYEEDECVCCDIMLGDEEYEALRLSRDSLKTDEAYNLMYEQPEFCENCIDRELFIRDLYCKAHGETSINIHWLEGYIKELPSVLPKADRPTGKWIPHIGMNHQCSVCGAYFPLSEFKSRPFNVNYCIECGARLESEDNNA